MPQHQKEVSAAQRRIIVERYTKKQEGFKTIGDDLGHAVCVIRRVLADAKVSIRGRGRPRKQ